MPPGWPAPRTPDSALITARYRAEQSALGHQAVATIRHIWTQGVNPESFEASWPSFYPMLRQVVLSHYRASSASAVRFYKALSYAEGRGLIKIDPMDPVVQKLNRVSDSVAKGTFYHQLNKLRRPAPEAAAIAGRTLSGAGGRFALSGGRDSVIRAALTDPNAGAWERLTSPTSCSFCVSQAARGPFSGNQTDFRPHDYCNCVAVPLFRGKKPANAQVTTDWLRVTQGKKGTAARAAWDEYVAGGGEDGEDTTG